MIGVHPERHLGLTPVPSEVALPYQDADQEPGIEVLEGRRLARPRRSMARP